MNRHIIFLLIAHIVIISAANISVAQETRDSKKVIEIYRS